jgi:hypothetical protein
MSDTLFKNSLLKYGISPTIGDKYKEAIMTNEVDHNLRSDVASGAIDNITAWKLYGATMCLHGNNPASTYGLDSTTGIYELLAHYRGTERRIVRMLNAFSDEPSKIPNFDLDAHPFSNATASADESYGPVRGNLAIAAKHLRKLTS